LVFARRPQYRGKNERLYSRLNNADFCSSPGAFGSYALLTTHFTDYAISETQFFL
jgi:hypothetical protein